MSSLESYLVESLLGHSAAEKAFRLWWENIQDFLLYSLILLGLIMLPTTVINGTPIDCGYCFSKDCGNEPNQVDPKLNIYWVRKYCTSSAIDPLVIYFPYIVLTIPITMVLAERFFLKVIKSGLKLDIFYNLLIKEAIEEDALLVSTNVVGSIGEGGPVTMPSASIPLDIENTKMATEVSQSFHHSSSYFKCYLFKTLVLEMLGLWLLLWITVRALPVFITDVEIFCDVHGYIYECSGQPHQFYRYILVITWFILTTYLSCNLYTFLWLLMPGLGRLDKVMRKYRKELRKQHGVKGFDDRKFLGTLYDVYYKNKDLKLLLNFMAQNSGIAIPLRVLTLFDRKFRWKLEPHNLQIDVAASESHPESRFDAMVSFEDPATIVNNFSKIRNVWTVFTVEINPPPVSGYPALHVFKSDSQEEELDHSLHEVFSGAKHAARQVFTARKDHHDISDQEQHYRSVTFVGLEINQEHVVRVSTVVNGRAIARKIRKIIFNPDHHAV